MAVATPCWPAPVSAMILCFAQNQKLLANKGAVDPQTFEIQDTEPLLILWAPVWANSSLFSHRCAPDRSENRSAL